MSDELSTDDLFTIAADWRRAGHAVAIATVLETWGSSPRPPGSQLVVRDDMQFHGSVSGGCVEADVVRESLEVMRAKEPRTLTYGVSNELALEHQLACGGTVRIYVEPASLQRLEALITLRAANAPFVRVTDLETGQDALIVALSTIASRVRATCDRALQRDRLLVENGASYHPFNPPLRMVIVGAVHIARALVPMARLADYDVVIVDPRMAFANDGRFPGVELSTEWPEEAFERLNLDARTAVVILTHDPKIDDQAIRCAYASEAFYIGALGSKRSHAARVERLRADGLELGDRLHAPIGLPIGSRSPAEIAISIMAQVTDVLRHRVP